jgi:hypothetical protein
MVLAVLCAGVLLLFDGVTDRLIPLYAVGAFLAFTLSQAGMVMHWRKKRGPHWLKSALVNGLGSLTTGTTTLVVLLAKFVEGAWITLLFIPSTIALFISIRRHYHWEKVRTFCRAPVDAAGLSEHPISVVVVDRWSSIARRGIDFAARLSPEVIGVHVELAEHSVLLQDEWKHYVEEPFRSAKRPLPEFHILQSPYRFVIIPIVQFILELSRKNPERNIAVVIPELVEDKWYEYFLHNQRARLLEWVLLARGNERIFTVSAPWYIRDRK